MKPATAHTGETLTPAVRGDVAIVGMACTFPGARNVAEFWQNIVRGTDCIGDVPNDRWDPDLFYDADARAADKLHCKRGGYLGSSFAFNPLKYGTMPRAVEGAEPDQFLVLRTVHEAIEDAKLSDHDLNGTRASFILGRGNYLGAGLANLLQRSVITRQTLEVLRKLRPDLTAEQLSEIQRELQGALPSFVSDTAPGIIPNITTGRVANRLDLTGATFTVDAACASSLIAAQIAVRDLLTGQCDLALAGGVHVFTDVPFLTVFTALGALSSSGVIRPFDKDCDGTLPGEGVGIVVLKRLADARRDGDRVYAVIKGIGSSSDGRAMSVTAPRVEGEVLALRRAYAMAGVTPQSVELIEAHGTGTPVGDPTELEALRTVFGSRDGASPDCAIGSVKSMIGHAMPAAGVASLIKTALSLYHGVLPPSLHCRTPSESLQQETSRFYLNDRARPWVHGTTEGPRRAGINAFGFGGVNAHVVLEEGGAADETFIREWDSELCLIRGDSREAVANQAAKLADYLAAAEVSLRDLAFTLNCRGTKGGHTLAVVATSIADLRAKLTKANERLASGERAQIKDTSGIYYFDDAALRGGKVAFLFPGLGAEYPHMLAELCMNFPQVRACFDGLDRAVRAGDGSRISADVFPPSTLSENELEVAAASLAKIERANPALMTASGAMFTLLEKLRLRADMMTGHSSGEWVSLPASGMASVERFTVGMSRLSEVWGRLAADRSVPHRVMLAVGTDRGRVETLAAKLGRTIWIVNDNCAHQVVVVVRPEDADEVRSQLLSQGVFVERLPYEHGYHCGEFTHVTAALRDYFESLELQAPGATVYSCATASPYPAERTAVVELLSRTFAEPVRFRETIEAMYRDGAKIFIEVGPRANLTAFVDDILRGRPHLAVATNHHRKSDLLSLHHALGRLAAAGAAMDLEFLYARRAARVLTFDAIKDRIVDPDSAPGTMRIPLHYKLMKVSQEFADRLAPKERVVERVVQADNTPTVAVAAGAPTTPPSHADAMLQSHFKLMEQFLETQDEVMRAYLGGAVTVSTPTPQTYPAPPTSVPSPVLELAKEVPVRPVEIVPQTVTQTAGPSLTELLLSVVSERTGYPVEMLGLDADMEADLGIDSIKRVEILGTLQQLGGENGAGVTVDMEKVAKLKTLRQVVTFLDASTDSKPAVSSTAPAKLTIPGEIVRIVEGKEVVVRRCVDIREEIYLEDHRFGPRLSDIDDSVRALPVVPLTVSVESMAKAAALLKPGLRVVGVKEVQASKWIDLPFEGAQVWVEVSAKAIDARSVQVFVRQSASDAPTNGAPGAPVAQAIVNFDVDYPTAPAVESFNLKARRAPIHSAEELYSMHRMFHGPCFQGVTSLDAVGEDGLTAKLKILKNDRALRSNPSPTFHIDPFLLDAAGQLVGYWPVEYLNEGFVLFPIRIRELTLFGPHPAAGTPLECRLRIAEVSPRQLRADMDLIAPDGTLWMRIVGWEDWRFYFPPNFYDFWRFPNQGFVSEPLAINELLRGGDIHCRRMAPFGEMGSNIWENLWAHLICSRAELAHYHAMKEPARRTEWIFGRAAAKDAVRAWVKQRHGLALYPADVVISQDERGRPSAGGHWTAKIGAAPCVSISHKGPMAVAAASATPIGIDLENVTSRDTSFEAVAFDEEERRIIAEVNGRSHEEWLARAWTAKEAAGKAMGNGLSDGPATIKVRGIRENGDDVTFSCKLGKSEHASNLGGELEVRSVRDGDFVIGLAVHGGSHG